MIGKWLKHILGINELENRLNNIENEKVDLESRIVEAENEKALVSSAIEQSVSSSELISEAQNFLEQLNIKITKDSSAAALSALKAVDAVIRYDLKRYVPPIE